MDTGTSARKTILINGATSGIKLAAAQALAEKGACVIGTGRSPERCRQAAAAIRQAVPGAAIEYLPADLSSKRQVRVLAAEVEQALACRKREALDVLVNTAGAVTSWHFGTVRLSLESQPADMGCAYGKDCAACPPSPYAQRPDEARKLWALSERLCGSSFRPHAS